ncbi:MAG: MopE-related protein, partial [Myxococcota bacterium]|nr:MopE-related protein [Myxococcota bacterium]
DGYGNDAPSNPNVDAGSDCDDGDSLINPDWDGDSDGFHVCIDCDDNSGVTYPGAAYLESSVDCMEDSDGDGYGAANASIAVQGTDCDDADMAIHPAASEVCDGLDNNCNNQIDDEDGTLDTSTQSTFYLDGDIDGYGDINSPVDACALPSGYIDNAEDCDDANNAIFPGATEGVGDEIDQDCDGEEICYENADGDAFRTATEIPSSNLSCGDPGEALASMSSGDCDDASATTYPGAAGNESAPSLCRRDDDGDGYGDSAVLGNVTSGTDCDDSNSALHPGVDEVCDGIDNDCDSLIDDADDSIDPSLLSTFYRDGDSDGYGDPGQVGDYCAQPGGSVSNGDDCDDSDATLTPEDNDFDGYSTCDGDCDDSDATRHPDTIWYSDGDGDGYGDPSTAQTQCQPPATDDIQTGGDCDDADASLNLDDEDGDGYSTCDGDCDDFDDTRSLDDLDSDGVSTCDGDCDDSDPTVDALDADSDGFSACVDDCDDADPNVNPDAAEDCGDGIIDNDCSDFAVCLETDLLHVEVEGDASNGDSKLTHYIASGTFGTQQYIGFGNREAVRNGTSLVGSAYLFQRSTIASGSGTLSLSDRILELQIHDTGGARRFGDSILFGHDINQDTNSLPDLAVSQRMNAGRGIYFYWSDTPLTSPVSYSANTTTESGYDAYLSIASSLGSKSTGSQWGTTVRMSNLIASTTEEELVFGVYTGQVGRGLIYVVYDGLETLGGNHEIDARTDSSSDLKYFSYQGEGSAQLGFAIDTADLDGDGQSDLIASSHNRGQGYVSIVLGPLSTTSTDIKNVDFRIRSTRNGDRFGYALMAGDLEEDGDTELAVHASNDSNRTERVYIYDLHSMALAQGESGFGDYFSASGDVNAVNTAAMIIEGQFNGELLTVSMDFIGDYIAVGAARYNGNQGAVGLFRYQDRTGDSEANRTVYFDPSDADYFFYGSESSNTMAGSAVKNVGDLNGDGHDDLMIGSAENDSGAGLVQVVYGPF